MGNTGPAVILVSFIAVLIGGFLIFGGGLSKSKDNILLVPTLKGETGPQGPAGAGGDFSKLAYVNQSNAFAANNTFGPVFVNGFFNVSNSSTLGNGTATFWNISQQLFVGDNRSAFPFACGGTDKFSSLDANGFLKCSADLMGSSDYSKLAYVNQSNQFDANNTFRDVQFFGFLNNSNSTTLGNTSIEKLWSNLIPYTDLAWNLGASALRWSDNYLQNVWSNSINATYINGTYLNATQDINTSRLFVGQNRSAFPSTCAVGSYISSLKTDGSMICTITTYTTDYSKLAYVNQSNAFAANNTFQNIQISGWLNVSNSTTLGNTSISNLNASILYVGLNRSAFPIACSGTNKLSSLSAEGFWTCGTDLNNQTDYANICYLNQTNTFTNVNTLSNNWNFKGFLNNSNSTMLGNTTIWGDFNVTNLTVLGKTIIQNYPAISLIFDNETDDVLTDNVSFKFFTLPANNFTKIIIETNFEIDGATGSAYNWILEFRNSTAIWKDVNITEGAVAAQLDRYGGSYTASAVQTLSTKLNVTFFPITKGSAVVGIQGLTIYGVS